MTARHDGACRETLTRVSAYLDGELGEADCRLIEQHCRDCPPCARIVSGLRETIGMCRDARKAPLPKAVRDRARASVRKLLDGQGSRSG